MSVVFGVLGCMTSKFYEPDPWEEFIDRVVWPLVKLNQHASVALLAVVVLAMLIIGLFADVSPRERRVCGALPLICGVATFIGVVIFTRDREWWKFHSEAQTTLLAFAFAVGALGLLVSERRLFVQED